MLAEGDPKIREFIKESIYNSFRQLLIEYNGYPKEFTQDTNKLSAYERDELKNKSNDAMEGQLKESINQLRDDYDQEDFKIRLHEILNKDREIIDEDLLQDLITYIKYGKKRRQD